MLLLEKDKINIRQIDVYGRTLLHWAAQEDAFDIAEWLSREAPDLMEQKEENAQTPLRIAAGEGHIATVGVLLEHGAAVNPPGQLEGESALEIARLYGHETIVMMLEFARDRPGLLEEMRKRFPE
jgi:ankyrin repeat protein